MLVVEFGSMELASRHWLFFFFLLLFQCVWKKVSLLQTAFFVRSMISGSSER